MNHNQDNGFLANVSHEMRTPLNVILGFAKLLNDSSLTLSEQRDYVKMIEKNSSQLLKIVDDILDLSKAGSGQMSVERIEFSLPELIHEFIESMWHHASAKNLKLLLKLNNEIPKYISSDPTRIRQILNNVVGNAIKFTDAGQIQICVGYENDQITFDVIDSGCGINELDQRNIFRPFQQANSTISRVYGGSGLGLALTQQLCRALNGDFILVKSEAGQGSHFRARVGIKVCTKAQDIETNAFSNKSQNVKSKNQFLSLKKILLVEDSLDNQALFSIYLNREGAAVTVASDGQQGFDKSQEQDFDIILMDLQMPNVDGVSAVRMMREAGCKRPILALTAHVMNEEREKCIQAGFSGFLSKPICGHELTQKILTFVN